MTEQEAIKELSVEYFGDSEKIREAKKMAIEALKQEPCKDCISRESVDKAIQEWIENREYDCSNATYYLHKRIDKLPSVQPMSVIEDIKTEIDFARHNTDVQPRYTAYTHALNIIDKHISGKEQK